MKYYDKVIKANPWNDKALAGLAWVQLKLKDK